MLYLTKCQMILTEIQPKNKLNNNPSLKQRLQYITCGDVFLFLFFIPIYLDFFQVFAIVGGTFTVAGIIDSLVFTASELFKKFQLGKLN